MKRTCNGCRALHIESVGKARCLLQYPTRVLSIRQGKMISYDCVPLESCPKPLTRREFLTYKGQSDE